MSIINRIADSAAAAAVAGLKTEFPITQRVTAPVAFIGDSFTDGQKVYAWTYSPTSYANQAAFYSGGRIAMVNNAGVAGETAAQILARVDAGLIAFAPRYGVILAGTNDCVAGTAAATTMTPIVASYRKMLAAGIEPIAVTIAPIDAEPANTLATALNVEIRRVAAELGIRVFDLWAFVRDPATGKIKASYAADSIHLNELGAHDAGLAFLAALDFPAAVPGFLPVLVTDTGIRSDLFVDDNADGVPNGWADGNTSGGMTFTCTGGAWTVTTTGANALVYLCALGAAPAAGTRLALAFKISTTHTDPAFAPQLYLQTSTGGTQNNLRPFTGWTMDLEDATVYAEWEVPATPGDMTLVLYAPAGAAGQIRLSKLRLFAK